jgi:putative ABC transport system substrate-binding protein
VDKILRGAKPAELAVEQTVGLRARRQSEDGKQLGVTIPPALVARADHVIQ